MTTKQSIAVGIVVFDTVYFASFVTACFAPELAFTHYVILPPGRLVEALPMPEMHHNPLLVLAYASSVGLVCYAMAGAVFGWLVAVMLGSETGR